MLTVHDGLRLLASDVWAVDAPRLRAVEDFLRARAGAIAFSVEDVQLFQAAAGGGGPRVRQGNGVAIVPVYGILTQHQSLFSLVFGGSTYTGIVEAVRTAMADESVSTVVLDVDSGGGQVHGAEEAAVELTALRGKGTKRITAVANPFMASAAYWVASSADEIVGTVSSETGSIGVFMVHTDTSEADAKDGIKRTIISAGKHKVENLDGFPLTDEARAALEARAEYYYDLQVRRVAVNRGATPAAVRAGYGEGRVLQAKAAKEANLIDRIGTLDEVVARALSGRKPRGMSAAWRERALGLDAA